MTRADLHPSETSTRASAWELCQFFAWCAERGIESVDDLALPVLERYQAHVHGLCRGDGGPLCARTRFHRLAAVRLFGDYLVRAGVLATNAASELRMPRLPKRLPRGMLSVAEVHTLLSEPDIETLVGLRDRAVLELLYATAVRSIELIALEVGDVSLEQRAVHVQGGRGRKERWLPLTAGAAEWLGRYLREARPGWASERPQESRLFVSEAGRPLARQYLEHRLSRYARRAGLARTGVFHALRDTVATAMLENGADVRFVQELLGHVALKSTMTYTRVSITDLREVHAKTHPAELAASGKRHGSKDELVAVENDSSAV